tara:strand:+ start:415 stop:813 length:399 start_codon:yes stop_codon:yes gene_type:complete
MHKKGEYDYKDWIKKDYSYNDLIASGIFKPEVGKEFDLLITKQTDHDNRMIYIKKVIKNGFDPKGDIRIKYGNIHKVKGTTFDNVIGDLSTYRPEFKFASLRLLYTMFSRGIYDAWILNSSSGKQLGNYVRR